MTDFADKTDEQLARECQRGSLDAFEELVQRHEGRLFNFLCQKAPRREDAEDLAQHTFINAWQRINQYRSESSFATWLYTIARNLTISYYRKHGKVTHCELEVAEPSLVERETPADTLSEIEEHAALWRIARETLKEEAFDALWLKYKEHQSIAEIATILTRTEISVKVILHRARKKLGHALEDSSNQESVLEPQPEPFPNLNKQIAFAQGGTTCSV
jgi:RNA polymerase sigma-70 factor (ECF subfamily)